MQTDATFWSKIIVKKFSNDFIHMKILNEFRNKYHQIQKKKKKLYIKQLQTHRQKYLCTTVSVKRKVEIYVKKNNFEKIKNKVLLLVYLPKGKQHI